MKSLLVLALGLAPLAPPTFPHRDDGIGDEVLVELRAAVVGRYAEHAYRLYGRCTTLAEVLDRRLEALVAEPSQETLAAARAAWIDAREVYGMTEALRFYNGPIDGGDGGDGGDSAASGVETLLNAWPIDESYVDAVVGRPDAGIVNDAARYPHLAGELLVLLNERGGEANVCVGWHAIEFLLWGQDLDDDGPGARPHTDYVVGAGANAARRGEYLLLCGDLLVRHLTQVRDAWAPGRDNYRRAFVAAPEAGVRRMLAGLLILSGFEMAGERLAVAYETRDQEEEHSCFSDTTHVDFVADQLGILAIWNADPDLLGGALDAQSIAPGPGLRALALRVAPALADEIDAALETTLAALRAIPAPFDRAMRGDDDEPGRRALLAALVGLESQAHVLAAFGLALGHEIALQPGG